MARAIEVAVVEAVEGKTRAQQIARLKEWKKFWLGLGAEKVVVQEVAVGNLNGGWIFPCTTRVELHTEWDLMTTSRTRRALIRLLKSGSRLQH